jgi:hypothetical protein
MKPDPSGLPNTYLCNPGEEIKVVTTIDHPPFLAQFPLEPYNGNWTSVTFDQESLTDTRTFNCSPTGGEPVIFDVAYNEKIPDDAPYNVAKYSTTFSSITNPVDPPIAVPVAVPKGLGPILNQYSFKVA